MSERNSLKNKAVYLKYSLITALFAFVMVSLFSFKSFASSLIGSGTQDYRNRVLDVAGIYSTDELDKECSRSDFAKMLVTSTSQKDVTGNENVAAANDVPAGYENVKYISIALKNNWMRNRLTGNFEPESTVTLNDAVKAAVTMLGYTDDDFNGNLLDSRLNLFKSLELNDGVDSSKTGKDGLTRQECMNIIYNLLRCNKKNSSTNFGSDIELTLASDGEINASSLLEITLNGPVLVKTKEQLKNALPFDIEEGSFYFNGQSKGNYDSSMRYYQSQLSSYGWLILYYNKDAKTVWAYGADSQDSAYYCVRGKVNNIIYDNDNLVSPTSVVIANTTYSLNSADVKFMFSVGGEIKNGDDVILICKDNTTYNSDGEDLTVYYAVGVIKYDRNEDGSNSGTIFAGGISKN